MLPALSSLRLVTVKIGRASCREGVVSVEVYVTVPPVSGTLGALTVLTRSMVGLTLVYVTVALSLSVAALDPASSSLALTLAVLLMLPPVGLHTRCYSDLISDVCSSDLSLPLLLASPLKLV